MVGSFFAAVAGLCLLPNRKQIDNEQDAIEYSLFSMIFAYWLVYCVTTVIGKTLPSEWGFVVLSINITRILAYLLTATCSLSLPLQRVAIREIEE